MAKTFDEMTYRQDFEAVNGRQPLDEELEHAKGLVERYTVGKDGDNGVVTYHPSKKSCFKDFMTYAFGWIMRGGSLLVMTPVFLTLLFFNLIKSTIGVFVLTTLFRLFTCLLKAKISQHFYTIGTILLWDNQFPGL